MARHGADFNRAAADRNSGQTIDRGKIDHIGWVGETQFQRRQKRHPAGHEHAVIGACDRACCVID